MSGVALVVLTRYLDILDGLHASIVRHEPRARRIVVTSGEASNHQAALAGVWDWEVVAGIEPFVFARNANLGIQAAGRDDVLLINDDCRLVMPLLEPLRAQAYAPPAVGLIAPQVIGGVGNEHQIARPRCLPRYPSPTRLAFVCVYLPRTTIDRVGLLDERFTGYGGDDDDYDLRVRQAGLACMVAGRVRVKHGTPEQPISASFARVMTLEEQRASLYRMAEVFAKKHGGVSTEEGA